MLLEPCATPVVEINEPLLEQAGVRLLVKRVDLVHPVISGNKWYKLKYNLIAAREQGHETLLSFGGAYSNHIHALAGAGKAYGFKTIGVIRGEPHSELNSTLCFATEHGMQLFYVNRADYRQKNSPEFIAQLHQRFGDFYLVPEGGTNTLAVKGACEIVDDIPGDVDVVACACGTGGTLAGVITGLQGRCRALGIAVLKGAGFLYDDVQQLLDGVDAGEWTIDLDYHLGGYAKSKPELMTFLTRFEHMHGIQLDPVYTAKLMYALYTKIEKREFKPGATILALHTGGLQGRMGFGLD